MSTSSSNNLPNSTKPSLDAHAVEAATLARAQAVRLTQPDSCKSSGTDASLAAALDAAKLQSDRCAGYYTAGSWSYEHLFEAERNASTMVSAPRSELSERKESAASIEKSTATVKSNWQEHSPASLFDPLTASHSSTQFSIPSAAMAPCRVVLPDRVPSCYAHRRSLKLARGIAPRKQEKLCLNLSAPSTSSTAAQENSVAMSTPTHK